MWVVLKEDIDPIASILISSYHEANTHMAALRSQHPEWPPTRMLFVHHLRWLVQAHILGTERYELRQAYTDHGRVEVHDRDMGGSFLLRSRPAAAIREIQQRSLFDLAPYRTSADTELLVTDFGKDELRLFVAPAIRLTKYRIEAVGAQTCIGAWPYGADIPPPFDQGNADLFDDLTLAEVEDEGQ